MILFVHIPKTAGTSFREGLAKAVGNKYMISDYGPDASETDFAIRHLHTQGIYTPEHVAEIAGSRGAKIICGHFPLSRYHKIYPKATVVSFVRDPLQRCYSEYLHWKRMKGYLEPFEKFIQIKGRINLQSRWLQGLPENSIIGVGECYNSSVQMINKILGLSVPILALNCNRKKLEKKYSEVEMGRAAVSFFYSLNERDNQFYNKIRAQYPERVTSRLIWASLTELRSIGTRITKRYLRK